MNPFLNACGATGPLLLGIESPGASGGEARAFDLPFVLVGRDPQCDLRLDAPEVSDRHAYFQLVGGQLVCADLGSRFGVYQDGKCRRLTYVERDRAVRIGPYRIRLLAGDAAGPDGLGGAPGPGPGPLSLLLSHRSVRRSRAELPEGLSLVGSAADCAVRLLDTGVSAYHCSLANLPDGVWVVDLLGQGGVRANGHEVGYARLVAGDTLQVGHSEIRLGGDPDDWPAAAPEPAALPAVDEPALLGDRATDLVERIVTPLVSQVGLVQRQMVDELNQARAMMFETFSSLHQEQSAYLNRELEQLRQLSQDLHALRADLERQTRLLAERGPAARNGAAGSSRLVAADFDGRPVLRSPHAPADGPLRLNGPGRPRAPRDEPAGAGAATDHLVHAQLCERIGQFQQEQKTRWQRLLSRLPGAGKAPA